MGSPTEKEYGLLAKFRENIKDLNLKDEQLEDMFLLRWIRARENDLGKAEDMLRKSLKWHELNNMDNIFTWKAPDYFQKEFPHEVPGSDGEGSPVFVCPLGVWDLRKIVEAGERDTYVRFVDQIYSKLFAKLKEEEAVKKNQSQFVVIIDVKGLSLRQFTSPSAVETALETFRRFEANFPETLKSAYIINAPRIFPMAFALVKPLLSSRTQNKINIYNSSVSKWKPALVANIPASVLPIEYGGTYVSTNKIGIDINDNDKSIPSKNTDSDGLVEMTVAAGGKLHLEFDIDTVNSILRWEFKTDHFDIGFSIIYSNSQEEVYGYDRYDSHMKKIEGSLICEKIGIYTLVFDNTYSRLRSKTLRYLGTVTSSLETEETSDEHEDNGSTSL